MEPPKSDSTAGRARPRLLRNWVSLAGLVVALGSLFSFLLLFVLDTFAHFTNPYIGVLTYLVAPGFLITGFTRVLSDWPVAAAKGLCNVHGYGVWTLLG